jgi:hypothetical protein
MKAAGIDKVIDDFNALMLEEKKFALEIIRKIYIEARRESILKKAKSVSANYKRKKIKTGSAKDLYNDLEND